MTIGATMARFYLAYLGTSLANSAFCLAVGVLMGCWIGSAWKQRRAALRPGSGDLLDVAYSVGVVKAAHPFCERCVHGVQLLNECLDCPDGCPQVVS